MFFVLLLAVVIAMFSAQRSEVEISYAGRTVDEAGQEIWLFNFENSGSTTVSFVGEFQRETERGWNAVYSNRGPIGIMNPLSDFETHFRVDLEPHISKQKYLLNRHVDSVIGDYRWRISAYEINRLAVFERIGDFLSDTFEIRVPKFLVPNPSITGPIIDPANPPPETLVTKKPPSPYQVR